MVKEIKSSKEFDRIMGFENANNIIYCPHCSRTYLIDWTKEERQAMLKWSNRELLIQDAMPNRNANEREIMRYAWSGLPMIACCDECLKEQYGSEDE